MKGLIGGVSFSLLVWTGIYLGVYYESRTTLGYDLLALQSPNYQPRKILRYLPKTLNLGILDGTFGLSLRNIRLLLNNKRVSAIRIHLSNGSGLRNGVAQKYEITYGYTIRSFDRAIRRRDRKILRYIRNRTKVFKRLAEEYPETVFMISPVLEHNLTTSAYRVLAKEIHRVWPDVQLVTNPQSGSARKVRGALLEDHSKNISKKAEVISLDGIGFQNVKLRGWLKNALNYSLYFIWEESFNCRKPGAFVAPRSRKKCVSKHTLKLLNRLLGE